MNSIPVARKGKYSDLPRVAEIYNQGIEGRTATFETRLRTEENIGPWVDSMHPFTVVESMGRVDAFAVSFPYSLRECYSGIAEFSVYVWNSSRRKGLGRIALQHLIAQCELAGFSKLISRVFTDNKASREFLRSLGFREVGIYEKHGKLDGKWRDTAIVELLISKNMD